MVLSRRKLKQKLQLEHAIGTPSPPSHPLPDNPPRKRKRRPKSSLPLSSSIEADEQCVPPPHQEEADESHVDVIDQSEVDRYRQCIEKVIRGHSGRNKAAKVGSVAIVEDFSGKDENASSKEDSLLEPLVHDAKNVLGNAEQGDEKSSTQRMDNESKLCEPKKKKKKKNKSSAREDIPMEKLEEETEHQSPLGVKDQDSVDKRTIYVGGIPYYSSEDDIRSFFSDCGTISTLVLKTFPDSGKFRGIAFLTFKTEGGAQRALAMDGASMGSCFLKIIPYSSKSKDAIKVTHKDPPKKTEGYTRAYIGNLSWDITEEDIRTFFKNCKIDSIRFSSDKTTGEFQGFGHIDFADDESLERALQLDQQNMLGRPIKIAYAVPRTRNEKETGNSFSKFQGRKEKTCFTCGEKGHLSIHCKMPKK